MKRCYSCFKVYPDTEQECPHCGAAEVRTPVEPIQLYPGTVLANRYLIGLAIGSGGFGIIYTAWDMKLETVVAVKEFYASRMVNRAIGVKNVIISKKSQAEFAYRKERFLAEARNMAKFGSHKNIPNVFEVFEENNTAYIVMELLKGTPLDEYLKGLSGPVDVEFAVHIANEVGNALKSLHKSGIIHRDVAPDNIYICSGKNIRIKLLDLGAAKLADSTDDVIDIILKPGYSPPEQYDNGKNIGTWSDVYALGSTLYVMLTRVKPDESTNRKIQDAVEPAHKLNPEVPESLSNAIAKAMALEKHMRFKTMDDFLAAINGKVKVSTLEQERKKRKRRRFGTIAASLAVVALLAGLVFQTFNQKRTEQTLAPADISVWYGVEEGSDETAAMQDMVADFMEKFSGVTVELTAIPQDEYNETIRQAAEEGKLPDLFESTGLPEETIAFARDASGILKTEQARNCLFLNQYSNYYSHSKKIPLAIEVPMAVVITNGAAEIEYSDSYFDGLHSFGEGVYITADARCGSMIRANFGTGDFGDSAGFFNNVENTSPVLLTSSMAINEVRETLTNYVKKFVFLRSDRIYCRFTYEWSLGEGSKEENAAAERLLTWMLGNVYQSTLMISKCNDGQIPINQTCFQSKLEARNLAPILAIYEQFVFIEDKR